ncbi:hypothetical protein [Streptomyces monashensis]|uniref:Uncharacterized protein n=1 Tax=Streptomyces monashensis TaxID=1678012 RepID=A0A1S2NUW8_9ACTN|nr:hypothetical protein [Streptomyces monashensis]OIJ85358.1 hypothetical protein BIV23_44590 [Streptomyces monashensis]
MKLARSTMVAATVSAAAALAATGITYASAASAPTSAPQPARAAAAPAAAPAVAPAARAAAPAPAPATAPEASLDGGSGQDKGNGGRGEEGRGDGGRDDEGRGDGGRGGEGRGRGHGHGHREGGRILINERSYSAHSGECITVVSGLGARTINVRNDSRSRVEVFRGAVCDNGAPIASVGAHSDSYGVNPGHTRGIHVKDGVVASFRVNCDHGDRDDDY